MGLVFFKVLSSDEIKANLKRVCKFYHCPPSLSPGGERDGVREF